MEVFTRRRQRKLTQKGSGDAMREPPVGVTGGRGQKPGDVEKDNSDARKGKDTVSPQSLQREPALLIPSL